MRLWHKDLIAYLPKNQLIGQWRELNSIYKLQNKHILINFVYEYEKCDLYYYSILVLQEMKNRGYKYDTKNMSDYFEITPLIINTDAATHLTKKIKDSIFDKKMNTRYLRQCLYNLQEKYDCGGVPDSNWDIIEDRFDKYL